MTVDKQEKISSGEAIAGMIINGLGFSQKPLSLTPLFFEQCPLSLLFRPSVVASDFNRYKLGRVLDDCYAYSTELLFGEIALNVCRQEGVDTRFNSLDTTSFSLYGQYQDDEQDNDDELIKVKLGYSKAHRPDLKQVMLEMMVTQDGGIPLLGRTLDGNASDNTVFKDRAEQLLSEFKSSDQPRYLIADSKLYSEKNANNLKEIPFITRIPNTISKVSYLIEQAVDQSKQWKNISNRKVQVVNTTHYGITQRWHIISSETSRHRAVEQVKKRVARESVVIEKKVFHLQAQRFACTTDAEKSGKKLAAKWKYHDLLSCTIKEHPHFKGSGRPKKGQEPDSYEYQVITHFLENKDKITRQTALAGYYVLGTNIAENDLSSEEVIEAYRQQSQVEKGFKFLKDPLFFTSSLFIKKPERIMGLMMVMLLSLLVYGIAERRMRQALEKSKQTLPNQIRKKVQKPTLRWVFQMLNGINIINISTEKGNNHTILEGITPLKRKILKLFGSRVARIYQI